ncbi:hypothetical protein [Shewanella surugensis]|uniref:Tetratricopeptide repeat protein n=1 Tax=Shewanella surugensis TaxID=212020 RepID=A0ABT0LGB3_9GAMM|nr:hypothetical protein [Shewanella surugensis]MCL1126742.1 hypothetical protein [Shewanella surugensis]
MKIIAIIIIVLIGIYLYRRNKAVSTPEATIHDEVSDRDDIDEELLASSSVSISKDPDVDPLSSVVKCQYVLFAKANERLQKHVEKIHHATSMEDEYNGMLAAITECYKQRQDTEYSEFGAGLSPAFLVLCEQISKSESLLDLKAVSFMQLATLLNDKGDFDEAIAICQQAIDYGLTDGTVTCFSGRKKRIERAKHKQKK